MLEIVCLVINFSLVGSWREGKNTENKPSPTNYEKEKTPLVKYTFSCNESKYIQTTFQNVPF